nr:MAG TPA: hypothetical protein [Caudoviricetes sp.]
MHSSRKIKRPRCYQHRRRSRSAYPEIVRKPVQFYPEGQ